MAKMRVVTPVYDHGLGMWVWPNLISVDEDEEEDWRAERMSEDSSRGRSRGTSFASSRTSTSSR